MWSDPRFSEDLVTFTEEILNGKLHFLSSVSEVNYSATNKILVGKELLRKSLDTSRKCEICCICQSGILWLVLLQRTVNIWLIYLLVLWRESGM